MSLLTTLYVGFIVGIIILNLRVGLTGRRDSVLAMVILATITIVYVGNNNNPDYDTYALAYERMLNPDAFTRALIFEPGFRLLMRLSLQIGLSYQVFVGLVAITGFVLIHRTVNLLPGATNLVYPLYFLYPFILDVIQLRNFLATAVVIFGFRFLIEKKPRHRAKFVACLIIAANFHVVAIFYAAFAFLPSKTQRSRWPLWFGSIGVVIFVLTPNVTEWISPAVELVAGGEKFSPYFETRARAGFLVLVFAQVWNFLLLRQAVTTVAARSTVNAETDYLTALKSRVASIAYNTSLLAFVCMPLYVVSSNFWRLPRNLHILYYLAFFVAYRAMANDRPRQQRFAILVGCYTAFLVCSQLVFPLSRGLVRTVIDNNGLIHALGG